MIALLMAIWAGTSAWATMAQPVPIPEDESTAPQLEIQGVGIGTFGVGRNGEHPKTQSGVNFSDSALFIGGAQKLYDGAVGSLGIGGVTTDESNRGVGTQLFLHQAFVDYQSESFEAIVGRSDNPTAHGVDFPTLRGDDLVTLTNPLNPFSDGRNVEEHRYANLAQVTFNQELKFFESFHVQHLINSAGIGSETGSNSFGVNLERLGAPGMEAFETFPSLGVGYEHITSLPGASGGLHQIYGGGVMNLNESITHRWDLRAQDIVSLGSELRSLGGVTDTYQADSNALAIAIRYLHSPFGTPGYQLALTGGYKSYFKVADARSYGLALTGAKRLGQGFELVAQVQGQWRSGALASAQSSGVAFEQVAEVGFVLNFASTFNQHIAPRRTLLNQNYQYLPN